MPSRRIAPAWGLALVCLVVLSPKALAGYYRDAAHHFTMDLPPGWQPMSEDELKRINANSKSFSFLASVSFIQGFRPAGSAQGSCPFALVQFDDRKISSSYEEIEESVARDTKSTFKKLEGSLSSFVKDVYVGTAVMDRQHNQVLIRLLMNVKGVGELECLSVGHIGSDGVVFIHSYSTEPNYAKYLPDFNKINDSFQFDQGHTFTPSPSLWSRIGLGALSGALRGAIFGGLIGLIAGGAVFVFKKATKQAAASPEMYSEPPPQEAEFPE